MAPINYTENMVELLKEINCNRNKQVYLLTTIINYKWLSLSNFSFHLFPSKGLSGNFIFVFQDVTQKTRLCLTVNKQGSKLSLKNGEKGEKTLRQE